MLPILLAPLAQVATHIVVGLVLDRVSKFRADTDWTKVKIDADGKVRSVIPGTMLDDAAVRATNEAIDKIQAALGEKAEFEKVLEMLGTGDFNGATAELLAHTGVTAKAA